jgi:ribosomal protein S18 acetylase RimI-like enzyme
MEPVAMGCLCMAAVRSGPGSPTWMVPGHQGRRAGIRSEIALFGARSEGVIVGMSTLVTFPLPSGLRARIEDVVIDQDARGRGVGTALTMAALDLAQA